uniref:Uncharacterized protein n=1 Tax=Anopheles farauti TaxID=69004 RepID=A0A182QIQ0_9DIPT
MYLIHNVVPIEISAVTCDLMSFIRSSYQQTFAFFDTLKNRRVTLKPLIHPQAAAFLDIIDLIRYRIQPALCLQNVSFNLALAFSIEIINVNLISLNLIQQLLVLCNLLHFQFPLYFLDPLAQHTRQLSDVFQLCQMVAVRRRNILRLRFNPIQQVTYFLRLTTALYQAGLFDLASPWLAPPPVSRSGVKLTEDLGFGRRAGEIGTPALALIPTGSYTTDILALFKV